MTSLVIQGKRWFNRRVGNTYYSAIAYADGLPVSTIGYAYGYGSCYLDEMFDKLERDGLLPQPRQHSPNGSNEAAWRYCERLGIRFAYNVTDVQRKKDL